MSPCTDVQVFFFEIPYGFYRNIVFLLFVLIVHHDNLQFKKVKGRGNGVNTEWELRLLACGRTCQSGRTAAPWAGLWPRPRIWRSGQPGCSHWRWRRLLRGWEQQKFFIKTKVKCKWWHMEEIKHRVVLIIFEAICRLHTVIKALCLV